MSPNEIPVLDVADLQRPSAELDAAIRRGFGHFGLVYLRGHGIPSELLDEFYGRFVALLRRDREEKESWARPEIWFQRGWTPPNTEVAVAAGGQPDFKECWFAMVEEPRAELTAQYPELFAGNLWPAGEDRFRDLYLEVGQRLQELGLGLLRASARALELEEDTFARRVAGGAHVTRALKYLPVTAEQIAAQVVWGEEHTDFNLVTLLPGGRFYDEDEQPCARPDDGSGLFLRTRPTAAEPRGRLIPGTPPPGCIVAQVGQELEILTGGTFLATPHVITAPKSPGLSRTSLAHFVHVHPHEILFPLEPFQTPTAVEHYRPPKLTGTYATKTMADIGLAPAEVLERFGYRATKAPPVS
jgi:isopenicillin N synthase-like dioxygenase